MTTESGYNQDRLTYKEPETMNLPESGKSYSVNSSPDVAAERIVPCCCPSCFTLFDY